MRTYQVSATLEYFIDGVSQGTESKSRQVRIMGAGDAVQAARHLWLQEWENAHAGECLNRVTVQMSNVCATLVQAE